MHCFIFCRSHTDNCRAHIFRRNTNFCINCIITQWFQSIIIACVIRVSLHSYTLNIFDVRLEPLCNDTINAKMGVIRVSLHSYTLNIFDVITIIVHLKKILVLRAQTALYGCCNSMYTFIFRRNTDMCITHNATQQDRSINSIRMFRFSLQRYKLFIFISSFGPNSVAP